MIWPLFRFWGRNLSNFSWLFGKFEKISKRLYEINWPLLGIFFDDKLYIKINSWLQIHKKYTESIQKRWDVFVWIKSESKSSRLLCMRVEIFRVEKLTGFKYLSTFDTEWFMLNTHPSHALIARYTEELNQLPYR